MENLVLKRIVKTLIAVILVALIVYILCFSFRPSNIPEGEMVTYSVMGFKPGSLDPGTHNTVGAEIILKHIYDSLYDYDYLNRPYQMIPVLADGMPEISDDGLTYTIKLKKGLYFTDDPCFKDGKGRELIAQDFVYSWKRIANIKTLSPSWWVFDDHIVGLDEFREYTKTCETSSHVDYSYPVEGLKTLDSHTFQIQLKKPWPHIIYNLSKTAMTAVAREAIEYYGKNIINHPIGTGSYRLKQWNKESYIELERNEKYNYGFYPDTGEDVDREAGLIDDAGKKLPFIDRVYFMKIQEEPPAWFLFLKGKLDATGIPKDNFSQVIVQGKELTPEMKERKIILKTYKLPDTYWIGFNLRDPVIGENIYLRQAVGYAIDRDKFIDLFANGTYDKAFGLIPPLMKSYNLELSKEENFDIDKAKELVEKAKEKHGGALPELTLKIPGTSVSERQYGQFFQKQLDSVGIKLKIDYLDVPTYYSDLKNGQFQMYLGGVSSSAPIAYNILRMFHSTSFQSGNYFRYNNKEYDQLFDTASIMSDAPERTELYRRCEKMLLDDCVAVFIYHSVSYTLHHSWVENYKPSALQHGLTKFIKIDSAKRNSYQLMY
jgi:ABC-type transport system substrate-binding protein